MIKFKRAHDTPDPIMGRVLPIASRDTSSYINFLIGGWSTLRDRLSLPKDHSSAHRIESHALSLFFRAHESLIIVEAPTLRDSKFT